MHHFLIAIKRLTVWSHHRRKNTSADFQDGSEIMFAVLWSIFEHSTLPGDRQREDDYLYLFCVHSGISEMRQRELATKVRAAHWDALSYIHHLKGGIQSFFHALLRLCLYDRHIEYSELRLIYLAAHHLGIPYHAVTLNCRHALRSLRYRAIVFFERPCVAVLVTSLLILNAIQLGMMVSCDWLTPQTCPWFFKLDFYFMCLFSLEILCRIWAFRREYFAAPQNWFDFIIIVLAWIPLPGMRMIAPLRMLRTLLLVNRLKQLKSIMKSLMVAIPNISWVFLLMVLFYYVFGVLATYLFGEEVEAFSTLPKSLFSLFQLMTLEGWPDLVQQVMQAHPYSWLLFVPFMLLTSYVLLNLVVGIIVTAMQDISLKTNGNVKSELEEIKILREEIQSLSQQVLEIRKRLP